MPSCDVIRYLRKYDIGAVFAIKEGNNRNAIELIWKFAIDLCLKDNAVIGNANAKEDNGLIGVEMSEQLGLEKIAKNCRYCK